MVRITIIAFILVSISSCILSNIFSIKPCAGDKAYSLIDTSAFYLLIKVYRNTQSFDKMANNEKEIKFHNNGLKFYGNGRVAFFNNINPGIQSLNPKYASKGIYCFTGQKNEIEFKQRHIQSGVFFSKENVDFFKDTI